MKTIKIIDILNKIANGGEVPYRIKYNGRIYEYVEEIKWYLRDDLKNELSNSKKCLNDLVEIIEDSPEDKKIEKIKDYRTIKTMGLDCKYNERKEPKNYSLEEKEIVDKINEIIDKMNGE